MPNENMLIVDWNDSCIELKLDESSKGNGRVKFKGKFQEAEAPNKNKRIYPYNVLDENVKRLKNVMGNRGLIGELDHPNDSIIHFEKASHIITNLWWNNNVLMGEGEILNTPCGRVLKALIEDGVRVGISSRGVGNGKTNDNGVLVIGESYKLITFDAVADPSTFEAFQEKVINKESHTMEVLNNNYYNSDQKVTKNEGKSINKISKEALIAAMGVILKERTGKVKSEI